MAGSTGSINLTFATQLRYVTEWFEAFSQLQKADFLPILVEAFGRVNHVNGLPPINDDAEPSERSMPSIFECRVKLFTEWSMSWNDEQWDGFISGLRALDTDFVTKFEEASSSAAVQE